MLYYAQQIFQDTGATPEEASSYTLWVGVLKIVGTVVAVWQVDKLGRRPLLLGGIAGVHCIIFWIYSSYKCVCVLHRCHRYISAPIVHHVGNRSTPLLDVVSSRIHSCITFE